MKYSNYPKKVISKLISLQQEGLTSTQIAVRLNNEFGSNYTSSSVRHKLVRLGKSLSNTARKPPKYEHLNGKSVLAKRSVSIGSDGVQEANVEDELPSDFEDRVNQKGKTDEYLAELAGYDPKEYEVINSGYSTWQAQRKGGKIVNLYAIKVRVKKRTAPKLELEDIINLANKKIKPVHFATLDEFNTSTDNLFIPMSDFHLGWTSFDDLKPHLDHLAEMLKGKHYSEVVIGNMGDFFHSDQFYTTQTASGTILDDVDMDKAVEWGFQLLDYLVGLLTLHCNKISYRIVEGNHDRDLLRMFNIAVKYKYPDLHVYLPQGTPKGYRTAFNIGHVGILMAHGDLAKKQLAGLFPTEFKSVWSKAKTYEIFTGHYHTEKFFDDNGVMHRQIGCPKPSDPYEIKLGFTQGKRVIYGFEYTDTRLKAMYEF